MIKRYNKYLHLNKSTEKIEKLRVLLKIMGY